MNASRDQNNRKSRRHPPRRSTRVICFKGALGLGRNLALSARDVSQEGICLVMMEPLPVRQEVEINLESIQHRRPLRIPGVVVWSRTDEAGQHLIGIRFEKYLPYHELQVLAQLN